MLSGWVPWCRVQKTARGDVSLLTLSVVNQSPLRPSATLSMALHKNAVSTLQIGPATAVVIGPQTKTTPIRRYVIVPFCITYFASHDDLATFSHNLETNKKNGLEVKTFIAEM